MFPKQQIDGFEKYWRRRKPGSSTAVHYSSDVRIFFKWAKGGSPEEITVHDVDEFIEWQQSLGRAPATIRRRLISLRMFYDYLSYVCEEKIDSPVMAKRHYVEKGHRLPRDIRRDEIEKLFAAIGNHLRDRTIFTLMLHTGIRVGEVINLRLKDIYLSESRSPHLRVNGKGQRERVVYLSASAVQLLTEYQKEHPGGREEQVFLNERGKPISITGIQLQLAKYCRLASIWVTCHQLRHTFACRMIAAGVPVTSVQKMLGHASLRTTQLYVQVADRQVEHDYHTGIQKVIEKSLNLVEVSHG
ncbi:MAG: tyrosine-type recombinase/integrase [Anaerolineaceae bacterium]|nr:tyrosine-type recombinase/integrase [Anaerolineaceae bacterium]